MKTNKLSAWLREHKEILLLLVLIFAERVAVMCMLGPEYNIANDDMGYIGSGDRFITYGVVGIYRDEASAMIMPGMPWLIGLIMCIFGQEAVFWIAIKLIWALMGTATAYFVYKSVTLLVPKWCGLIAAACFLAPNLAWMDNIILTETPYFLCFTLTIYLTLLMGKTNSKKVFAGYCAAYIGGVLLRPTIVIMPAFSLGYLFLQKVDRKLLLRRLLIGIGVLALFLVPWTVRNYMHFDAFVPLTYGSGNPMLLGSYQGFGYPSDEELDYDTHVEQVWRETFSDYLDEEGNVRNPGHVQFLTLEKDGIKAKYRMSVWWENNPISMLLSYLLIKPGVMLVKTFYWQEIFGTPELLLDVLRAVNFFLCCGAVLLCFMRKRYRMEIGFLTVVYWVYIYSISLTYSFSRYGETLMSLRYIIMGVGLALMLEWWKERKTKNPAP